MLGYLSEFFTNSSDISETDAYLYAMGISIAPFVNLIVMGLAFFQGLKIGMVLRVITTAAIYKKVFCQCVGGVL